MKKGPKRAAWAALVVIGVLLAIAGLSLLTSVKVHAAENEFRWKHFGADPFAKTRSEAMANRERVFREFFGLSNACAAVAMKATSVPGKTGHLNKGDRLSMMMSRNFVAHPNTIVDFPTVQRGIENAATTENWEFDCEGQHYRIALPDVCYNLSLFVPTPLPKVSPQAKCYVIPFDYRNTSGVVWDEQHRARVSVHLDVTEKELEAASSDSCLAVVDARGSRKPFHRCESCVEGQYPPAELARAVGLPAEAPKSVLSFHLQDGKGYVSLPPAWAARWMLYCVDVIAYPVSVRGYQEWQAVSRFDIVEKNEVERTLSKGTLDRTLFGTRHY